MIKLVTVVGARPQFIKAAVISRLIRNGRFQGAVSEFLVHTGQHYDPNMSGIFFEEMDIPQPDLNLSVGSGTHGRMTGAMLAELEQVLLEQRPDLMLVYGDTNSTLAGALAASKLKIPVAHVEAGLRSFMMAMPEEQNRRITDHLATYLFCPTQTGLDNLRREGIAPGAPARPSMDDKFVSLVGDIMLDASLHYRDRTPARLEGLPEDFYLLTLHRAENTDEPARLAAIVNAVNRRDDLQAVCPLHPRTRLAMEQQGLAFKPHVRVLPPVGYLDMLALESACRFVATDSGGVQKEAYFFRRPCITLREATEWVELVDCGWNRLAGADEEAICSALGAPPSPGTYDFLYGSGRSGEAILDTLLAHA